MACFPAIPQLMLNHALLKLVPFVGHTATANEPPAICRDQIDRSIRWYLRCRGAHPQLRCRYTFVTLGP